MTAKNPTAHEKKIIDWIAENGPSTDREVAAGLGETVSRVQPYISKLIKGGVLKREAKVLDRETNRTVRRTSA